MTDTHTEALKPCPFCDGPVHKRTAADFVSCYHLGRPHCPVGRWSMTIEQWNTRAAIEALPARNDERALKLVEALRGVREFLMSAPMESGVCCCGSPVDGHGFGDGHSPVDELSYAAQGQIERIDTALADTQPSGETRS